MVWAGTTVAQTVYSNGPTNGNTDAWTIDFGFVVSDTFLVANNGTEITGFTMADWLTPGSLLTSAELSITSGENGGTSYFDQVVSFTQSNCTQNRSGYDVCDESAVFQGPTLNAGTYWINIQNASTTGEAAYWDENSGPALASENSVGSIPSESFTVLGSVASSTVPEPGSGALLGSGLVALVGLLRRRLL
jgi:hypothetical protein